MLPSPIQTLTVGPGISPDRWTFRPIRGLSPPVGNFTPPRRLFFRINLHEVPELVKYGRAGRKDPYGRHESRRGPLFPDQGRDELGMIERFEVAGSLAHADEKYGDAELLLDLITPNAAQAETRFIKE